MSVAGSIVAGPRAGELDDGIAETLVAVLTALFGTDIRAEPMPPQDGGGLAGTDVIAAVPLYGAGTGVSIICVTDQLAGWLAGRMFGLDRPPQAPEINDAVGELANMITGNMKALLPHPCQIGLPEVGATTAAGPVSADAVVGHAAVRTLEGTVTVLLQFDPQPGAARRQGGDVTD